MKKKSAKKRAYKLFFKLKFLREKLFCSDSLSVKKIQNLIFYVKISVLEHIFFKKWVIENLQKNI